MSYIKDDFLLESKTAIKLYKEYAKHMPIFDYHCHLPEKDILENKQFKDIYDLWLSGDHYKWRLMRNYGIDEKYITGNAEAKEKFFAFCKVVGTAFGNPIYHWSQLELKEFFKCELEINEKNAQKIWEHCNNYIKENNLCPQKMIEDSNVKIIFTTNEAFDELSTFDEIKKKNYKFKVIPAFRADKLLNIDAEIFNSYLNSHASVCNIDQLEKVIEERLNKFIEKGTVASDIALENVFLVGDRKAADNVLKKKLKGKKLTYEEVATYKGYMTYFLIKLFAKYNIRTELHIGAMRNNNTQMFKALGLDKGYDTISEENSITNLRKLLDRLNDENSLPPMIFFNLNQKMNMELITLLGCYQDSSLKGKMQYGPAWWHLDTYDGNIKNMHDFCSLSHLDISIGMLTDSRSFLSYTRHDYFRRLLCNYLAEMIEKGQMTSDLELVGSVIENVCYNNAINYFNVK